MGALERRLKQLIDQTTGLAQIVGFGSLTCVSLALPDVLSVRTLPEFAREFSTVGDTLRYFEPKIVPFILICVTIFWYYRHKGTVIEELGLINNVFEEDHAPLRFASLDSYRFIAFIGYLLVGTYCALILLAPHISLYCIGALVLHFTDLTGGAITLQNLYKMLAKYPVLAQGSKSGFINERREVLKEYYFGHPTLPRIGVIIIVTTVALIISLQIAPTQPAFYLVSYALMVINVLTGELIISRWRAKRDQKLDDIMIREEDQISGKDRVEPKP